MDTRTPEVPCGDLLQNAKNHRKGLERCPAARSVCCPCRETRFASQNPRSRDPWKRWEVASRTYRETWMTS
ncbi:mCG18174, isoform CRA_b [Mus musculus]|nr:mCG18174, isoform CRA_b [Mus musculus]